MTIEAQLLVTRIYKTRDRINPKIIHVEYKYEHVKKSCIIKPEGCNSIEFRLSASEAFFAYQFSEGDTAMVVPYLDDIVWLLVPICYHNPVDSIITSDFKIVFKKLVDAFI